MIELPRIEDPRGNLSFIEHGAGGDCPFEIEKVSWIYDVPAGTVRRRPAMHFPEMVVAMSGSFDVSKGSERVHLNRCDRAEAINSGELTELNNFSSNSVAMILSGGAPTQHCNKRTPTSHSESSLDSVEIMTLPRIRHDNGSLTMVDNSAAWMPFAARRVFYLFDVPADAERGGHSHHQAQEIMVALTGSFDVVLDDGKQPPRRYTLNRPYQGLYIPTGIWRILDNFSGGAVCLVITSERYSEADYVRDYETFKSLTAK